MRHEIPDNSSLTEKQHKQPLLTKPFETTVFDPLGQPFQCGMHYQGGLPYQSVLPYSGPTQGRAFKPNDCVDSKMLARPTTSELSSGIGDSDVDTTVMKEGKGKKTISKVTVALNATEVAQNIQERPQKLSALPTNQDSDVEDEPSRDIDPIAVRDYDIYLDMKPDPRNELPHVEPRNTLLNLDQIALQPTPLKPTGLRRERPAPTGKPHSACLPGNEVIAPRISTKNKA
jgi:hypothetical protein